MNAFHADFVYIPTAQTRVATCKVTSGLNVSATAHSFSVSWSSSDPYPSKYQMRCVCSLLCEDSPVANIVLSPASQATTASITGLLPGSECDITLTEYSHSAARELISNVMSTTAKTSSECEQSEMCHKYNCMQYMYWNFCKDLSFFVASILDIKPDFSTGQLIH